MTAPLLGLAWGVAVIAFAARRRPVSRSAPSSGAFSANSASNAPLEPDRGPAPLLLVGRVLLRRAGRAAPPALARGIGLAVVVSLLAALAWSSIAVGLGTGALVAVLAFMRERFVARRQRLLAEREVAEVIDLLLVCVGAGLTVRKAVETVTRKTTGSVSTLLVEALERSDRGVRFADALCLVAPTTGVVGSTFRSLAVSEREGVSLHAVLERLADEARRARQRRAEEAARRLPVLMLFPLVFCTLPAFALLTAAPLIVGGLRSLSL